MPPRRGSPVLFEVLRRGNRPAPAAPTVTAHTAADHDDHRVAVAADEPSALAAYLAGGRSVRVPVGWFFVAAALTLALIAGGYFLGYKRAEADMQREAAQRAGQRLAGGASPVDPLLGDLAVNPTLLNQPAGQAPASGRAGGDPRVPGLNYLVLARVGPEDGDRIVQFLRAAGVDATTLPIRNNRLVHVIALKGFAPESLASQEYREYEAALKNLGRQWKRQHGGPTDFSDLWAQKYAP